MWPYWRHDRAQTKQRRAYILRATNLDLSSENLRWQRSHFAYGILQHEHFLVSRILAQYSRVGAETARVRFAGQFKLSALPSVRS